MTSTSVRWDPEFVCPVCGYDRIAELAVSVVLHEVSRWKESGEPEEYEDPEVEWETDFPYASLHRLRGRLPKTFECRRRCEQFERPVRPSEFVRTVLEKRSARNRAR